jgi:hypothetical protein
MSLLTSDIRAASQANTMKFMTIPALSKQVVFPRQQPQDLDAQQHPFSGSSASGGFLQHE